MFMSEKWVDALTRRLALKTSRKLSRRDYLSRIGYYAAGLFGVSFGCGVVVQSAIADTPKCTFKTDCSQTGQGCGMGNTRNCALYLGSNQTGGTNTTCKDCTFTTDNCPKGLTKATTSWTACCTCQEDKTGTTDGHTFQYWDCCGTPDAACNCTADSVKNCRTDLETTRSRQSWCNSAGTGTPTCTWMTDTGKTCTPKKGDVQVVWDVKF
jgi:hypothetical protein